jgi:hypothetical protein
LNGEVDLSEVVSLEFRQVCIGLFPCRFVLGCETFGETAAAVLAGAAAFRIGFASFGCGLNEDVSNRLEILRHTRKQ